jgi:hypothetical protein
MKKKKNTDWSAIKEEEKIDISIQPSFTKHTTNQPKSIGSDIIVKLPSCNIL